MFGWFNEASTALPAGTARAARVAREGVGQDSDRDLPTELGVAGALDLAHAAGPKGGRDLVRAKACARDSGPNG